MTLDKRSLFMGSLLVLVGLLTPSAAAGNWEGIEQLAGLSPVVVLVGGESRNYFRVTTDGPLNFQIEGPSRLRIYSRVEMPKETKPVLSYLLRLNEKGAPVDSQDTETSAADDAALKSGAGVSKSRRMDVEVSAGIHTLSLSLQGVPSALIRIQQSAPLSRQKTVSLTPVEAHRSISIREDQKTITYYSVQAGKPVKLRVVGPTTLDLVTRLDFDATMQGIQIYRLALSEHGKRIKDVEMKTTRSDSAVFKGQKKLVPSKYDRFQVPLADGSHEILVELLTPSKGTAEIHARIPQPQVGHQE